MKKNVNEKKSLSKVRFRSLPKMDYSPKNMHNTIEFNYFRLMAEGVAIMLIEK